MSDGFSPEWLALREAADHRSRCPKLAAALTRQFAARETLSVVDFGCGTGSNIRATSALLGPVQAWTLVDYDPRLLAKARELLPAWADTATMTGETLHLRKNGQQLTVRFRQADLIKQLEAALSPEVGAAGPDLVTASALFDLASEGFIRTAAAAIAKRRAAFYTVLTYNGIQQWTPAHPDDGVMLDAFHTHQQTDKGFGRAAGPAAPQALSAAFKAVGYRVTEGDSPWVLGAPDQSLTGELAPGFANAVRELRTVPSHRIDAWARLKRTGAVVGHTDTLALPA